MQGLGSRGRRAAMGRGGVLARVRAHRGKHRRPGRGLSRAFGASIWPGQVWPALVDRGDSAGHGGQRRGRLVDDAHG